MLKTDDIRDSESLGEKQEATDMLGGGKKKKRKTMCCRSRLLRVALLNADYTISRESEIVRPTGEKKDYKD